MSVLLKTTLCCAKAILKVFFPFPKCVKIVRVLCIFEHFGYSFNHYQGGLENKKNDITITLDKNVNIQLKIKVKKTP